MNKSKTKKLVKGKKGITLIALIITIIVMLILVAVTVNVAINGGLFNAAKDGAKQTQLEADREVLQAAIIPSIDTNTLTIPNEQTLKDNLPEGWEVTGTDGGPYTATSPKGNTFKVDEKGNITLQVNEGGTSGSEKPPVDNSSKIGCYADITGDGQADGIIFADLIEGKSGQWTSGNGAYTYEAVTNPKEYQVVGKFSHALSDNQEKDVIQVKPNQEGKEDRFYVMALEDFNAGKTYYWYKNAYGNMSDYTTATSVLFGKGKDNTEAMIAKWDLGANGGYGAQTTEGTVVDMWGAIKEQVNSEEGWFVPSRGEWGAFADSLGVSSGNYGDFGLSACCWSSSQDSTDYAWRANFNGGYMFYGSVDYNYYVRLSATF